MPGLTLETPEIFSSGYLLALEKSRMEKALITWFIAVILSPTFIFNFRINLRHMPTLKVELKLSF